MDCPTGKTTFDSWDVATDWLRRLKRRASDRDAGRLRPYVCDECGGIHVSSSRKSGQDRAGARERRSQRGSRSSNRATSAAELEAMARRMRGEADE